MIRATILAVCVAVLPAATGCYDTPKPACTFECSADGECPSGYSCSGVDNICKRTELPADHVCEGLVIADAAVPVIDALTTDASTVDASTVDASPIDASPIDAAVPDAMVPDATVPDAMVDAAPDALVPVCGDNTTEGGEACDDNNDNNCGSCNMGCSAVQTPAAATGSITAIVPGLILDTETFTIDDGINTAVVFEFEKTAGVTGEPVDISAAADVAAVKAAIISAINGATGPLAVTASDGGGVIVTLTHDRNTSLGNQTVAETVTDATFVVSDLTGGVAGDCASGIGCSIGDDCASGVCNAGTDTCDP